MSYYGTWNSGNSCGCARPSCNKCYSPPLCGGCGKCNACGLKGKTRTVKFAECLIYSDGRNATDDVKLYSDAFAIMDMGKGCFQLVYSGLCDSNWGKDAEKNINGWIPITNSSTVDEIEVVIADDGTCQLRYNYDPLCPECAKYVDLTKLMQKLAAQGASGTINLAKAVNNTDQCIADLKKQVEALQEQVNILTGVTQPAEGDSF